MYLLDLSHTSHTRARTGVQRVCRSLYTTMGDRATAITWDPYSCRWRHLNQAENANLSSTEPSKKRGARWPLSTRLRGQFQAACGSPSPSLPAAEAIIFPEIFSPKVYDALPRLPGNTPRIAIFHDAIALKLPDLTPPGTVARFPYYLKELLSFNAIAAVSDDSRRALIDYWHWLGISQTPPVETIPLGIDPAQPLDQSHQTPTSPPTVLCVGSLEGRKNHLALLDACEALWNQKLAFNLRLIGIAHARTGKPALEKIAQLIAQGHPIIYDGAVDESTLQQAYQDCHFTVYPSLLEGFGLPVLESLQRGKPCICSAHGALGESARPGGALMLESVDGHSLAQAISTLLQNPAKHEELRQAALKRDYRTWDDYTTDLLMWIKSLT